MVSQLTSLGFFLFSKWELSTASLSVNDWMIGENCIMEATFEIGIEDEVSWLK